MIRAIIWKLSDEKNSRTFQGKERSCGEVPESSLFNALSWCKNVQLLGSDNFNFLVSS